jgi:hypothetical protein
MTTDQDPMETTMDLGDDGFDAELADLFADAAPPADDPVFTGHVVSALGKTDRVRMLAIGGAGATGSAVAGSQLEHLISGSAGLLDGVLGQAAVFVGPEAIVSALFAALALGVAFVLPRARLGLA